MKRFFSVVGKGVGYIARGLGVAGRATIALVGICGVVAALANYSMTQGSGTTFGSIVVSTVHYVQMLTCDPTTPSQCQAVNSSGQASVAVASLPLPSGAATSTNQASQITQETATASALGTTADSPCTLPATSTACTQIAIAKALANVANSPGTLSSQYPSGAVPLTASATGTTAATTATLAGTAGKTTYVCGYSIRANATANTNVTDTLTGVITGTMSSALWVPANTAGLGVDEQIFSPCIPASAQNTAIAAVSGAPGTGGLVSVKAWGYQQ